MRTFRSLLCLIAASALLTTIGLTTICLAEAPDRIAATIDSSKMVALRGHVQRGAKPEYDLGRVDGSFQLRQVRLFTVPTLSQVKALKQLLEDQQDSKSPYFHKWLTPAQYADRFGLSHNDVQKISAWLKSQGFTVVRVANGRNWIVFSGTAFQIENAFRTEIHRYNVNGEMHFANTTSPSLPASLSGIATGFMGLDDFRPKARAKKAVPRPNYYDANTGLKDFLAPNDIATIYDLGPLYTAAIDGTGEKMVVVGQTDVYLADLVDFRSGFSLPAIYSGCTADTNGVLTACTASSTANFQYVLDGTDPGVSTNDLSEADLDLEWSAATARGAQIIFYNSTNVFTSLLDAIDANLAPVISISYGQCEWFLGGNILTSAGPGGLEAGMMQASTNGITVLNSSGDSGAAECDPPPSFEPPDTNNIASWGLAVSYPASSPEVTAVGGTAIVYPTGFSSTFWTTSDSTNNGGTAQNPPLPEIAWNDDVELTLTNGGTTAKSWQESYAIVQSGGGVSNCALQNDPNDTTCVSGFPVPTWQSGLSFPTAPPTTGRYTPDVSLMASPNFPGYVYCTPIEELVTGTTDDTDTTSSCSPGGTAGITAAVNGDVSGGSYVWNPSVVGGTSASTPVLAGMVVMLNQFLNGANSPGLGNINSKLYELASAPANGAFHHVITGENMVYCSGDTPNPSFEINAAYLCPGSTGTTQSFGWNASNADATTGYNLVTGLGSVDANVLFTVWQASLGSFTLTPVPAAITAVAGHNSIPTTITLTASGGFNSPVSYSCSTGLIPGATCSFNPNTPTISPVVMTVATVPSMAAGVVPVIVSATGGGVTNTTTVNLTVSATDQSFQLAVGTTSLQVTPGQQGTASISVSSPKNGFNSLLTFTCSETTALSGSGSMCTIAPSIQTAGPVTLTITTIAPTGQLRLPLGSGRGVFYAALLPGLLGIVFTAGSRKRAARGIRFLSLIVVLGFSTLWLGSCSSNSSNKNSGTLPGSYVVTVNATTGGTNPVTGLTTVTLVVQ
jgi:subtilase family serine protease